ncbi:MAG: M23 family metallopeptidase [Jiangellaceae bacterium]
MTGRRATAGVVATVVCALVWSAPLPASAQTEPAPSPTSTPEPTPEPTTSTPVPTPTTRPPVQPPVSPPPPTVAYPGVPPSVDPGGDDGAAADALGDYAHDVMSAHSMAVAEAEAQLEQALAELGTAQAAVAAVQADAEAARAALDEARRAADVAAERESRALRELSEIVQRIADARQDLGAVARDAYQGGAMATLSVVLDAETPAEYADTYVGVRSVLRASDSALGRLAVEQADLLDARQKLRAVRERKEELAEAAATAVTAKEAAVTAAVAAQRDLDQAAAVRLDALRAAEAARLRDYQRYREFLAESDALRPVIVDLSALLAQTSGTVFGTGSFVRPGTGEVTSEFGIRRHPITGVVKLHTGTDIGRGDGYVYAADSGTVIKAEWNRAYGYMSVIDHGRGVTTLYGHQAAMYVRAGDRVGRGARIGVVGSTGYSTGPHLHFEVRRDGAPIDPWPLIAEAPLPAAAAG